MKKTYIEPSLNIVAVKVRNTFLSASDPQAQTLSVDGESISDAESIGSRRGGSMWDYDED